MGLGAAGFFKMLNDLPLMSFIRDKMRWQQARQTVLASNIANADTPGYRPSDLKPMSFSQHLDNGRSPMKGMAVTHVKHMDLALGGDAGFDKNRTSDFEVTPSGNGVVLEDEMIKVAGNQFDHQMASTIYKRSLGLLKIAIGRS